MSVSSDAEETVPTGGELTYLRLSAWGQVRERDPASAHCADDSPRDPEATQRAL